MGVAQDEGDIHAGEDPALLAFEIEAPLLRADTRAPQAPDHHPVGA